jgi:diacylglycerol kinase family enzyme
MPEDSGRRYLFLINPGAGGTRLPRKANIVARLSNGLNAETRISTSQGHASEIARAAMREGRIVVACGGDGLQNIVAQQAVETGGVMSVLPIGRGNDFGASLRICTIEDTAAALRRGQIQTARYIDLQFDGHSRICLTCAGVGLLSDASARAMTLPLLRGQILYAVAALISMARLTSRRYSITLDGRETSRDLLIMVGAASEYTGGGIPIAPQARSGAARLNILWAERLGRLATVKLLLRALTGKHIDHDAVTSGFFEWCRIAREPDGSPAPMVFGDGELLGLLPVTMTLGPKPLHVLAPEAVLEARLPAGCKAGQEDHAASLR